MEKFRYNIEQTARLLWMCGLCYNREIDNASRIIIEKEVYLDDRDGLVTTVWVYYGYLHENEGEKQRLLWEDIDELLSELEMQMKQ